MKSWHIWVFGLILWIIPAMATAQEVHAPPALAALVAPAPGQKPEITQENNPLLASVFKAIRENHFRIRSGKYRVVSVIDESSRQDDLLEKLQITSICAFDFEEEIFRYSRTIPRQFPSPVEVVRLGEETYMLAFGARRIFTRIAHLQDVARRGPGDENLYDVRGLGLADRAFIGLLEQQGKSLLPGIFRNPYHECVEESPSLVRVSVWHPLEEPSVWGSWNLYWFDRAQGSMPVKWEHQLAKPLEPGHVQHREEIVWKRFSGVWVPATAKYTITPRHPEVKTSTFEWESLGTPLDPALFGPLVKNPEPNRGRGGRGPGQGDFPGAPLTIEPKPFDE